MAQNSVAFIRAAKESIYKDIPEDIEIPEYCLVTLERAGWFGEGARDALHKSPMSSVESIINMRGETCGRSYFMGYEAGKAYLEHLSPASGS